jgi:hypothetical protein
MSNRITELTTTLYNNMAEYTADKTAAMRRNDHTEIELIEQKLQRSWSKLQGTQGTQQSNSIGKIRGTLRAQSLANGEVVSGNVFAVADANNKANDEAETNKARPTQKFMRVDVKPQG